MHVMPYLLSIILFFLPTGITKGCSAIHRDFLYTNLNISLLAFDQFSTKSFYICTSQPDENSLDNHSHDSALNSATIQTINVLTKLLSHPYQATIAPSLIINSIQTNKFFPMLVYSYQFLLLIVIGILISIIYKVIRFLFRKFLEWLTARLDYKKINGFATPLSIITIYILTKVVLPSLNLSAPILNKVLKGGNILLSLFCIFSAYQLVDFFAFYIVRQQTVTKKLHFNLILLPIIKVSLKVCVIIGGIISILQILQFDIQGLLAGVGIGGLGFALASQDTIKNFFGSLVILTDKPFCIGDYIVSEQIDGCVEEIGFRSTRIRTHEGCTIYAPNGNLANSYVTNYGEKQYKGFENSIAIPHNTPIETIETFIEGLRKIIERCPIARAGKHAVYLYELRESTLYIKFKVDFNVTEEKVELSNRQIILLHIIKLANHLGVKFAFSNQVLKLENDSLEAEEDKKLLIKDTAQSNGNAQKKLQDFFENYTIYPIS